MPPEMTTREGVPIARTGSYVLSTGPATFTEEDLKAAVAAYANDPAVHAPRIKIDGLGASFDPDAHGGEPALGTATNLRLSANAQEVLADVVIPKWLDDMADWAYPNRSIEGAQGVVTATGQSHDLVITAVALLGVDLPGISTLPDLADLLANGPPVGEAATPEKIMAAAGWKGTPVRAGLDQDIVRRRFVDSLEEGEVEMPPDVQSQWALWPCAIRFDSGGNAYLKVEDESTGRLYRYDFAITGNEVTFTFKTEVMEEDTPVAAGAPRPQTVQVWASRAESRPTPKQEEHDVDISAIREAAGLTAEQLPDDATPEQVADALRTTPAPEAKPGDEPITEPTGEKPEEKPAEEEPAPVAASAPKLPEGTTLIDSEELEHLRAGAKTAIDLAKSAAEKERDQVFAKAMDEGRFAPSRREHYLQAWERDPEGTRHLLKAKAEDGGLAPNLVPVQARGTSPQADAANDNVGTGLFPELEEKE
jgi:hypothetical protein